METLTPEKISELEEKKQEFLEQNIKFLYDLAEELSLKIKKAESKDDVSRRDIHNDFLSQEQKAKLQYNTMAMENTFYLTGKDKNGDEIKAVITARHSERDSFYADIFNQFSPSGWSGNHDFNQLELRKNLEFAIKGE